MKHCQRKYFETAVIIICCAFSFFNNIYSQTVTGKTVNQNNEGLSGKQVQLFVNPNVYTTTTDQNGLFTFNNVVSVKNEPLPMGYAISNNYPNPFNPRTRINFTLPKTSIIHAELFNTLEQKVHTDIVQTLSAGNSYIDLELNGLSNGIYFARITIDEKYSTVKKLMLLYGSQHLTSPVPSEHPLLAKAMLST
jgi:hypothetical protein